MEDIDVKCPCWLSHAISWRHEIWRDVARVPSVCWACELRLPGQLSILVATCCMVFFLSTIMSAICAYYAERKPLQQPCELYTNIDFKSMIFIGIKNVLRVKSGAQMIPVGVSRKSPFSSLSLFRAVPSSACVLFVLDSGQNLDSFHWINIIWWIQEDLSLCCWLDLISWWIRFEATLVYCVWVI